MGIARGHMAILSFLAGGLLLSIGFFVSEFDAAQKRVSKQPVKTVGGKTD